MLNHLATYCWVLGILLWGGGEREVGWGLCACFRVDMKVDEEQFLWKPTWLIFFGGRWGFF